MAIDNDEASAAAAVLPSTPCTDAAGVWHRRAVVRMHRYLHTVDVLMEGCGWDTRRSRELLGLLSGDKELVAMALAEEIGVTERELAALKIASGGGDGQVAAEGGSAASTPRKKGGKKGKVNKGK